MLERRTLSFASQLALLVAATAIAALSSHASDWRPYELVALLLFVAVASDLVVVSTKSMRISGSFLALVLAMALLGPAPAAAIGVATMLVDAAITRSKAPALVNNLATYAVFPLAGGLLIEWVTEVAPLDREDPAFLLLVFGTFGFANLLNFLLIAGHQRLLEGGSLRAMFRTMFVPVLPSELATGLLTVGIAFVYLQVGMAALGLLAAVLFTFQYLLRELLLSQDRAEELEHRSHQLASLQVGVLAAMIQTLSLRDKMTARHCAAVARYSREIARAAGCSEAEQELVHTAGLLHDIGKFIFPDSILMGGNKLTDEEWEIVKRHPAQGARVVRQVDGYGPVADIILCHHERIDGKGYPRGIAGEEVPHLARMISIADTYDVMTARDSYRKPVSPADAVAELRRVSGAQLDGELVEVFVGILERKGVAFQHADDADFEAELSFDKRVRAYAEPRAVPAEA